MNKGDVNVFHVSMLVGDEPVESVVLAFDAEHAVSQLAAIVRDRRGNQTLGVTNPIVSQLWDEFKSLACNKDQL